MRVTQHNADGYIVELGGGGYGAPGGIPDPYAQPQGYGGYGGGMPGAFGAPSGYGGPGGYY